MWMRFLLLSKIYRYFIGTGGDPKSRQLYRYGKQFQLLSLICFYELNEIAAIQAAVYNNASHLQIK